MFLYFARHAEYYVKLLEKIDKYGTMRILNDEITALNNVMSNGKGYGKLHMLKIRKLLIKKKLIFSD